MSRDRQTGMRNGKAELCLNDCRRIGKSVSSRSSRLLWWVGGKTTQLEHNSIREMETSTIKRCARKEASKTKGKARGKKEGKQKEMGGKDGRKTREEARKRTKQNKTKYTKKS